MGSLCCKHLVSGPRRHLLRLHKSDRYRSEAHVAEVLSVCALIAFGLPYLNGRDIRKLPHLERKTELKKIIAGTDDVQYSESFESEGQL